MPKKILLADDSITIQKVVELTFSDGDYEVSAVNNGAKAIQKLSELRPDIILSDIIMPEKNGYEVCEFVKSHPDFRNIPVILLTGTFEPFDPDRADKAGCDAVVTKPFESQSLIQKVEELIAQAKSSAPAAEAPAAAPEPEAQPPAAEASPWEEEQPAAAPPPPPPPAEEPFASGFQTHDNDIFAATPASTMETPFDSGAFGGETRAFPRMSFDELQQMASEPAAATPPPPPPPAAPEPTPWGEPGASPFDEAPATGGETRAFQRMSFEELQQMASTPAAAPEPPAAEVPPEPAPWDAGPQESAAASEPMSPFAQEEPPSAAAPEAPSPWNQQPAASPFAEEPPFSGETRAFQRMSFEDLQKANAPAATPEPPPPPPAPAAETSPWDEQPSFGAETRAFQRMSFDEMQQMAAPPPAAPAEETTPWAEPAPSPFETDVPAWSPAGEAAAAESFSTEGASPFADSLAAQEAPFESDMTAPPVASEEPMWAPSQPEPLAASAIVNPQITDAAAAQAEAFPTPVNPQITDAVTAAPLLGASGAMPATGADLTDDQIDRIARRVVQLMSEQVVKNIAWEVIPDLAEMVVKERIRQLESEA